MNVSVKDINEKIRDIDSSIHSLNVQIRLFQMSDGIDIIKDLVYRKNKLEEEKKELESLQVIYVNKNYSLGELSINFLKELCELELKEIRKEKERR